MAQRRNKATDGMNARPLNESIAETGDGIADEAVGPGQLDVPAQNDLLSDDEVQRMEDQLRRESRSQVPASEADKDS